MQRISDYFIKQVHRLVFLLRSLELWYLLSGIPTQDTVPLNECSHIHLQWWTKRIGTDAKTF